MKIYFNQEYLSVTCESVFLLSTLWGYETKDLPRVTREALG